MRYICKKLIMAKDNKKSDKDKKEYGGHVTHRQMNETLMTYLIRLFMTIFCILTTSNECVYMANVNNCSKQDFDNWLLDRGASAHMTPF